MRESGHFETAVVSVRPDDAVTTVADKMDLHAVGCVVVVDEERRPLGILTDRDLLGRVIAEGRGGRTRAGDVMSVDLVTGSVDDRLESVIEKLKSRRVRRLPIVENGVLVGIVAADDILCELGRELGELREAFRSEVLGARRAAPRRHRREAIEEKLAELDSAVRLLGDRPLTWLRHELEALRDRTDEER